MSNPLRRPPKFIGYALRILTWVKFLERDIAESETYAWPLSSLLPNVLKTFDLPDCYRVLQKKELRLIEPWGANAKPVLRTGKEIRP